MWVFIISRTLHTIPCHAIQHYDTHVPIEEWSAQKHVGPARTNCPLHIIHTFSKQARVEIFLFFLWNRFFFTRKWTHNRMCVCAFFPVAFIQSLFAIYILRKIHFSTSQFQWVSIALSWNLNVVDARTFVTTKTTNRFSSSFFFVCSALHIAPITIVFIWILVVCFEMNKNFIHSSPSVFLPFVLCSCLFWSVFGCCVFLFRFHFDYN